MVMNELKLWNSIVLNRQNTLILGNLGICIKLDYKTGTKVYLWQM
jgi:hypothetical protein